MFWWDPASIGNASPRFDFIVGSSLSSHTRTGGGESFAGEHLTMNIPLPEMYTSPRFSFSNDFCFLFFGLRI